MNTLREQNALSGIAWIDKHPLLLAIAASLPGEAAQENALDDNELFDEIDTEMMKRGTLAHSSIRWDWVCEQSANLLKTQAKDFRLLLYILLSLPHLKNCESPLALGGVLASRFIAIWGTTAHPAPPGRLTPARKIVNALEQLTEHGLKSSLTPELATLTAQSIRQSTVFFQAIEPALGTRLLSLPNRIEALALQEEDSGLPSLEKMLKEPVKTKPIVEVKETPPGSTPALELHPENLILDSRNERALKQGLTVVADFLLRFDMANPLSYRLRRFATWYGITNAPEQKRKDDLRTVIMPVSANALDEYRIAAERGQTDYEIAQKLERSCHIQPLWIEGQYLAYKLALMCDRKQAAMAIHEETCQFTAKTPWLARLQFTDSTPFIPDEVKSWLESRKKAGPPSGLSQENEMIGSEMQAIVRTAREKAGRGQTGEAIRILEQAQPATSSPRSQSLWEMLMLECLSEWGLKNLVFTQAARLENAIQDMPVKDFEPELIGRIKHLTA